MVLESEGFMGYFRLVERFGCVRGWWFCVMLLVVDEKKSEAVPW